MLVSAVCREETTHHVLGRQVLGARVQHPPVQSPTAGTSRVAILQRLIVLWFGLQSPRSTHNTKGVSPLLPPLPLLLSTLNSHIPTLSPFFPSHGHLSPHDARCSATATPTCPRRCAPSSSPAPPHAKTTPLPTRPSVRSFASSSPTFPRRPSVTPTHPMRETRWVPVLRR